MGNPVISERDETYIRVIKSLSRLRADGLALPVRRENGAAPVVLALPSDPVGEVEERVAAAGGSANVVLALVDRLVVWAWTESTSENVEVIEVHEASEMDMLQLWITQCEGPARFNLVRASLGSARELEYQF